MRDAPANLVFLDGVEQRLEVAFAEALIAIALNDFEEDRADHGIGEYLQQQALTFGRRAIEQNIVRAQAGDILAMPGNPLVEGLIVRSRRIYENHAACRQRLDGGKDIARAQRDMLNTLAVIVPQILGNLALVVGGFVDRNSDLAVRAGHCG
jgi:hypothetical protein